MRQMGVHGTDQPNYEPNLVKCFGPVQIDVIYDSFFSL